MNKEKLYNMIKKSQQSFLVENNEQITHVSRRLLTYLNKEREDDYDALYQFYHRIKGTSGTLELSDISAAAADIEELMAKEKGQLTSNHKHITALVKGTGKLLELIEEQLSDMLIDEKEMAFTNSMEEERVLQAGKILVVDDDITMLDFVAELLKNQGYEVFITNEPSEAVDYIRTGTIDLALIDIVMPEKSGFDIYEEISRFNNKVPILFMTGLNNTDVRIEALRKGAEIYLQKPLDPDELIARVNGSIKKYKMNEERDNKDELTKAFTRKHFIKQFEKEKQKYLSTGEPFSVAFLDLDNFKSINDNYGHLFGDHILISFVDTVADHLKSESKVFRFGGDEFLVLFPNTTGDEAQAVMENIRADVNAKRFKLMADDQECAISFSSGVAEFNESIQTKSALLEKADQALYVAKENGKDQSVLQNELAGASRNKILVVDDELLLANIIKTRLGYLGYEVDYAKDGQEALVMLKQQAYDLVLLDIMLPKVTGIEVLKTFKSGNFGSDPKIVMISGKHSETAVLESLRLGADDFFEKPFSLDVLEHKIKKILTS
ncbi:GGDEF domain-containing response regulator [Alkalibacterium sp.]|nr:MAG: response regulator [Alkalibacterium sp.]